MKFAAFFAACISVASATNSCSGSLGAPFLYVTTHGGHTSADKNDVLKYSRDGCFLGTVVRPGTETLAELRGMQLVGNQMYLANAYKEDSKILVFDHCVLSGTRSLLQEFTSAYKDPLLVHPYGLAADSSHLYVTNQDTFTVTRYDLATGRPLGVFVDFSGKSQSPRGLALDGSGHLWIANRDDNTVWVVRTLDGSVVEKIAIIKPIGVYYNAARRTVLIGSNDEMSVSERWEDTRKEVHNYSHSTVLVHPAGLACDATNLYVISQDTNAILAFPLKPLTALAAAATNATSAASKAAKWAVGSAITDDEYSVIVSDLPDVGEQLMLSPC